MYVTTQSITKLEGIPSKISPFAKCLILFSLIALVALLLFLFKQEKKIYLSVLNTLKQDKNFKIARTIFSMTMCVFQSCTKFQFVIFMY